jgi:hypothetical protein
MPEQIKLPPEELLELSVPEAIAAQGEALREALRGHAARKSTGDITLVRGNAPSLLRTYRHRQERARQEQVPAVGLDALIDTLQGLGEEEPAWGFRVQNGSMDFVAFADHARSRLIGIVIVPRRLSDRLFGL